MCLAQCTLKAFCAHHISFGRFEKIEELENPGLARGLDLVDLVIEARPQSVADSLDGELDTAEVEVKGDETDGELEDGSTTVASENHDDLDTSDCGTVVAASESGSTVVLDADHESEIRVVQFVPIESDSAPTAPAEVKAPPRRKSKARMLATAGNGGGSPVLTDNTGSSVAEGAAQPQAPPRRKRMDRQVAPDELGIDLGVSDIKVVPPGLFFLLLSPRCLHVVLGAWNAESDSNRRRNSCQRDANMLGHGRSRALE